MLHDSPMSDAFAADSHYTRPGLTVLESHSEGASEQPFIGKSP